MNRLLYIIVPVVLMAVFIFLYIGGKKDMDEKHAALIAQQDKEEAEKQADIARRRAKSAEEQVKADQERQEKDVQKDNQSKADHQAVLTKMQKDTDEFQATKAKYADDTAKLEKELADLRARKELQSREFVKANQDIIESLTKRQNAEMDIQRYASMFAQRAANSPLTRPPQAATPANQ